MENTKYYTPNISEFHVGFEYEYTNTSHQVAMIDFEKDTVERVGEPTKVWDKNTYQGYGFNDVRKLIDREALRVKYLDKEDIESLGWEYDNNAEPIPSRDDWNVPKTTDYELPLAFIYTKTQLMDGRGYYLYLYKDNTVWIDYIKDCCGMGYIFKGKIKNKSELKVLLKQLGIC